jgi:hypothetical protein
MNQNPTTTQTLFKGLDEYGNYKPQTVPTRGIYRIDKDGTIRTVQALGIPYVKIVDFVNSYGHHFFPQLVGYAIRMRDRRKLLAGLAKKEQVKKDRTPKPHPDLILCIREASRAAHRERDAAQNAYQANRHKLAGNSRRRKDHWYALKDRGISAAHIRGLLRYAGASPQCMAVYAYGNGGMSCFHSTIHPVGAVRTQIDAHPEVLEVPAKNKAKGLSLRRFEATLAALPAVDSTLYERSVAPRKVTLRKCWTCGEVVEDLTSHKMRHSDEAEDGNYGYDETASDG